LILLIEQEQGGTERVRPWQPADKSRPKLRQGPLVLVATADAKLSIMRLGNLDEAAAQMFAAESLNTSPPLFSSTS